MADSEFDSLAYWRERHVKYNDDTRGVGNLGLDEKQNIEIYKAIDAYVEMLAKALKVKPVPRVLDLGCGIGMITGAFVRSGYLYTGIDVSETATNIARSKFPECSFHVANIANLPLPVKYDVILERTVFIHLTEDDYWRSAISEVKRLLAPGGVFILMDNIPLVEGELKNSKHVRFRTKAEYEAQFEAVGLKFDFALMERLNKQLKLSPATFFASHV
jgi:SAM-dependent methyltransferase